MKVIMMEPSKKAEVKEIDGSLSNMQDIVGGWIELFCPFEHENVGVIVNEEGKILNLPANRAVVKENKIIDILAGPAFIVNLDSDEEDFQSLTDEQVNRLMRNITDTEIYCDQKNAKNACPFMERSC